MDNARNILILVAGVLSLLMAGFTVVSIGGRMHEAKIEQIKAAEKQKQQTDEAFKALDEANR